MLLAWLAAWAIETPGAAAHEVPATAHVHVLVRPEGGLLRLLVRAPLEAMRDVSFPLRGPGYLDLDRAQASLRQAALLWIAGSMDLYENGVHLGPERVVATRVSLPSDRSFDDWTRALQHTIGGRLPGNTNLPWQQAYLDVLLEVPITDARAEFSIRPAFAHLGLTTTTVLRFLTADGDERVFQYTGDQGLLRLDPRWHHAALSFVRLGFLHILDGIDHLLFILCLVIPLQRARPLIMVVTAFTVAHSLTLVASAFGLVPSALWFPPLVETLIAASILYMALENIVGARVERRWRIAFAFGLVHGFGFSFALRESLQFAGSHLATSLFAFNVGVELGQALIVLAFLGLLRPLFRHVVAERMGVVLLSAFVAHTAWHWTAERWGALRQYRVSFAPVDASWMATAARWAMLVLIAAGVLWLMGDLVRRYGRATEGWRRRLTGTGSGAEPKA
ncbi:MAG: HupE/UreJ family protein [Longimicrobiales bacterium]